MEQSMEMNKRLCRLEDNETVRSTELYRLQGDVAIMRMQCQGVSALLGGMLGVGGRGIEAEVGVPMTGLLGFEASGGRLQPRHTLQRDLTKQRTSGSTSLRYLWPSSRLMRF